MAEWRHWWWGWLCWGTYTHTHIHNKTVFTVTSPVGVAQHKVTKVHLVHSWFGGYSPGGCDHLFPLCCHVAVLHYEVGAADSLSPAVNHRLAPESEGRAKAVKSSITATHMLRSRQLGTQDFLTSYLEKCIEMPPHVEAPTQETWRKKTTPISLRISCLMSQKWWHPCRTTLSGVKNQLKCISNAKPS